MPDIPYEKLKASSEYGKGWHGTEVTPAGTVHHTDAVSRYPDLPAAYHERNYLIALVHNSRMPVTEMGMDFAGEEPVGEFTYILPSGVAFLVTVRKDSSYVVPDR